MRNARGFTLIELMIVVAIVAILAAIAVPAYQDYTIRAKLTEGFTAASNVKATVASAYASGGGSAVSAIALDYLPNNNSTTSKYIQYIEVSATGVITGVVSANTANGLPTSLHGKTFTLTPQLSTSGGYVALGPVTNGSVDWACASAVHTVADARTMISTPATMPAKYLPSECR